MIPVIKDRLVFKRIPEPAIKAYIIKSISNIGGQTIESVLRKIDNPMMVNPIKVSDSFTLNETKRYKLAYDELIVESSYPIRVYINDKRLSSALVFYNKSDNTVVIDYDQIETWDSIRVEYYIDGIEAIFDNVEAGQYKIDLDVDYSTNTIGDHNLYV